ncbi:MAG: SiaB family protein kinase [Bacteroidia bacterium]|nr:SiaB family protein kinase [Bacteroidia bacterium]
MEEIYDIYSRMEKNNILLSFKGDITSDLLTSILQIMESKMDSMNEEPKLKKKVYNVLVECLQNLYHHMEEYDNEFDQNNRSAIFMIGKKKEEIGYEIYTGNYILNENIKSVKERLDKVNSLSKDQLKEYYLSVLNNGEISEKGGGGLGMIEIARKSGEKINYNFLQINNKISFFTLQINVTLSKKVV